MTTPKNLVRLWYAVRDAIVGDLEPAGPFMIGIWSIGPDGEGTHYAADSRH